MKSLIKFILHRPTWQKLPPLPRQYSVEFKLSEVTRDTETMMKLSHTRSPQGVKILEHRHGQTVKRLIVVLPKRRRPRYIGRRFGALFRSIFGLMPYDPAQTIYQREKGGKRRDRRTG